MADNTYYGAGTYGAGTYQPYVIYPDSAADPETIGTPASSYTVTAGPTAIADAETFGPPTAGQAGSLNPASVADVETLGTPSAQWIQPVAPAAINNTEAFGAPAVTFTATAAPTSLADPETSGNPTAAVGGTNAPNSLNDAETLGAPSTVWAQPVTPTSFNNAEAFGAPAITVTATAGPGSIGETETFGGPTAVIGSGALPAAINNPETFGSPAASFTATAAPNSLGETETIGAPTAAMGGAGTPDPISNGETFGTPAVTFVSLPAAPAGISDAQSIGSPAANNGADVAFAGINDAETFGTLAATQAIIAAPDQINEAESFGTPVTEVAIGASPAAIAGTEAFGSPSISINSESFPDTLNDPESAGMPTIAGAGDHILFNEGQYGTGLYIGINTAADQTTAPTAIIDYTSTGDVTVSFELFINANFGYSGGTYGEGIYFGSADTTPGEPGYQPAQPLFKPLPATYRGIPAHTLGVGPWSPQVIWRGAPNYGVTPGIRAARPVVGLPPATSKSVTLRINDGSEATAEFNFTPAGAIFPEPMQMDLWWRRKDPYTGLNEVIGRFNTASADVSKTADGLSVSCSFIDYRTRLSERLVLKYKDKKDGENQWKINTRVVEILAFAVPTDMFLDLSVLTDGTDLGVTTAPFEIDPSSTIGEVFDNLLLISSKKWEWWVEMPATSDAAPVLSFAVGTRGSDNGVVLADYGTGPTPIASWTMNQSADKYANSLYFSGGQGAEIVQDLAAIALYGQRDASDSDSSVLATKDANGLPYLQDAAALDRLTKLSDQTPTFTLTLAPGWWRGRSHIDIGDTVGLVIRLGKDLISHKYRVSEITLSIDDAGTEQVELTLGTPPVSGNPRSRRSALARIIARLKNYERKGP